MMKVLTYKQLKILFNHSFNSTKTRCTSIILMKMSVGGHHLIKVMSMLTLEMKRNLLSDFIEMEKIFIKLKE